MLRSAERASSMLECAVDVPQQATLRQKLGSAVGTVRPPRQRHVSPLVLLHVSHVDKRLPASGADVSLTVATWRVGVARGLTLQREFLAG